MEFNPQGIHAEDIGNDPNEMTPSGLAEGDSMPAMLATVVAPPAYTDPSNPAAASGSVNLNVEVHPLDIAEDYGASETQVAEGGVDSQSAVLYLDPDNAPENASSPEDREKKESDWTVATLKEALERGNVKPDGNKADLFKQVQKMYRDEDKAAAEAEAATETATEEQQQAAQEAADAAGNGTDNSNEQ